MLQDHKINQTLIKINLLLRKKDDKRAIKEDSLVNGKSLKIKPSEVKAIGGKEAEKLSNLLSNQVNDFCKLVVSEAKDIYKMEMDVESMQYEIFKDLMELAHLLNKIKGKGEYDGNKAVKSKVTYIEKSIESSIRELKEIYRGNSAVIRLIVSGIDLKSSIGRETVIRRKAIEIGAIEKKIKGFGNKQKVENLFEYLKKFEKELYALSICSRNLNAILNKLKSLIDNTMNKLEGKNRSTVNDSKKIIINRIKHIILQENKLKKELHKEGRNIAA